MPPLQQHLISEAEEKERGVKNEGSLEQTHSRAIAYSHSYSLAQLVKLILHGATATWELAVQLTLANAVNLMRIFLHPI